MLAKLVKDCLCKLLLSLLNPSFNYMHICNRLVFFAKCRHKVAVMNACIHFIHLLCYMCSTLCYGLKQTRFSGLMECISTRTPILDTISYCYSFQKKKLLLQPQARISCDVCMDFTFERMCLTCLPFLFFSPSFNGNILTFYVS